MTSTSSGGSESWVDALPYEVGWQLCPDDCGRPSDLVRNTNHEGAAGGVGETKSRLYDVVNGLVGLRLLLFEVEGLGLKVMCLGAAHDLGEGTIGFRRSPLSFSRVFTFPPQWRVDENT